MTAAELLELTNTPANLSSLSDADLAKLLEPLIPQARAAYIGPRTSTVIIGNSRMSKKAYDDTVARFHALMAKLPKTEE